VAEGAVVVGAGPNGLAAAIVLAQRGIQVTVLEAGSTPGGGCRSAELTEPGFVHDICSAIHPLAVGSPFFATLPLPEHGLDWITPPIAFAHPLDGGAAATLEGSVKHTADGLGEDGGTYRKLMGPLVEGQDKLGRDVLGPLRVPRHPFLMARFGLGAIRSAKGLAKRFSEAPARALVAGLAAHSMLNLDVPITAGVALIEAMYAHAFGWPLPAGGAQRLTDALAAHLEGLGGKIECDHPVSSLSELPPDHAILLDVTPKGLLSIAGLRLPDRYKKGLRRFRYGPGVFKLDLALDGPVPWIASDCARTATLHIGGTFEEIAASEAAVIAGRHPERPFVIAAQHTLYDPSRAPEGRHTLWAYCHVPSGSDVDMTDAIEQQIERFAPGFRDRIIARSKMAPADFERYNQNYVGGDINGGMQDLRQHFARPVARLVPYTTPIKDVYICSSSTPPGGGVHGMCGYWAAGAALRRSFR
jgi:phytoene dehydrogenase-like protein